MRKGLVLALALALGLAGCTRQAGNTIRVGEVGSLTGSDASFGTSTHRGIQLALQRVNDAGGVHGKKLELISVDDQGKASEAVLGMTKLIQQDQVVAVLGEVASTLSLAMAPIAQQHKVPMISPSSIHSRLTENRSYVFRVCFVDRFQSRVMAEFALQHLHAKKAALLVDVKSDYSRDSAQIFSELFKKGGGEILIEQSYSAGDVDFKAQLTSIRAKKPDVILVPGYYTEIGLIARQKGELGISAPMLGGDGWDSPRLPEIGGAALEGSYFVSHFSRESPLPHVQAFVQKFREKYGEIPDGLAALGYDAAGVLAEALKRLQAKFTSVELRDSIAQTRDFVGVTGKISINSDRNAVKAAQVFKIGKTGIFQPSVAFMP